MEPSKPRSRGLVCFEISITHLSQAWDKALEKKFRPLPSYPDLSFLTDLADNLLSQSVLAGLELERKQLCTLQFDLAELVYAKEDFESRWLGMSPETRRENILQGLVLTCGAVVDMEERRAWCPETTMKYLERDHGKGFLNLLVTMCPNRAAKPQLRAEPIFISHPVYDGIYHIGQPCPPGENQAAREIFQRQSCMTRNMFLALFLWNTVLHVYGMSQEYKAVKSAAGKGSKITGTQALKAGLSKAELDEIRRSTKEGMKTAERNCTNCEKLASMLPEGKSFFQCTKCKAVGRRVLYCDK